MNVPNGRFPEHPRRITHNNIHRSDQRAGRYTTQHEDHLPLPALGNGVKTLVIFLSLFLTIALSYIWSEDYYYSDASNVESIIGACGENTKGVSHQLHSYDFVCDANLTRNGNSFTALVYTNDTQIEGIHVYKKTVTHWGGIVNLTYNVYVTN